MKRCSNNNDCQFNFQYSSLKDNKQDYPEDQDTSTSRGSFFYGQGIYDIVMEDKNILAKELPNFLLFLDDIWQVDFVDMELE